jgi:hypothetical protein
MTLTSREKDRLTRCQRNGDQTDLTASCCRRLLAEHLGSEKEVVDLFP